MTQIIVDPGLSKQLHGLGQAVELCDQSGKILGRFVPAIDLAEWEALTPGVSEEELDRRSHSSDKRYSTAEVMKHLESL